MDILSMVSLAPCRAVSLFFVHGHAEKSISSHQPQLGAAVLVHTEWTWMEHHNPAPRKSASPSGAINPASLSKPVPFSICRAEYTEDTLVPAATRGYVVIPTFGQDFSEHQTPNLLHSHGNELPSIHQSYCSLSWEVSALRKNAFIFILLLKEIHLLGWWVFRAFFTVLIAHHHFKSTWNGWLELLKWEKMHFTLFLLWYYQT